MNCFVGQWPFRHLPYSTLSDVRGLLSRVETKRALLTPLDAVFHKDCLAAVRTLYADIATAGADEHALVGVINPDFPGWRDDLNLMIHDLGCMAVRLFPNYHDYRLMDAECEALLSELQSRSFPLILSPRLEDERLHHWLVKTAPVPRLDLRWLLRAFPGLKIVLCSLTPDEVDFLATEIRTNESAYVDTSARMPQFFMEAMVGQLGADRVVFGTGIPLQYPECAVRMLLDAELGDVERRKIFAGNAQHVFGLALSTGAVS